MSGLFSKPATPAPPPAPPPPPTMENQAAAADAAARLEALKLQRGRASTLLTGGQGVANAGSTSKTLFGQ